MSSLVVACCDFSVTRAPPPPALRTVEPPLFFDVLVWCKVNVRNSLLLVHYTEWERICTDNFFLPLLLLLLLLVFSIAQFFSSSGRPERQPFASQRPSHGSGGGSSGDSINAIFFLYPSDSRVAATSTPAAAAVRSTSS